MKKPTAAANPASIVTDAFEKLVYAFTEGVRTQGQIVTTDLAMAKGKFVLKLMADFEPFSRNVNCAPGFFDLRALFLTSALSEVFGKTTNEKHFLAVPAPGQEDRVMDFPKITVTVPIDGISYEDRAAAAGKIDAIRLRLAAANMTNEKITPAFSEKCVKRYSLSPDELAKVTRMARAVKAPQQKQ